MIVSLSNVRWCFLTFGTVISLMRY
jgi:hypothetical protein